MPDTCSTNLAEDVLSSILARNINARLYPPATETFDWIGFMECVRLLAREVRMSLNEFVKKMLSADDIAFQRWQAETDQVTEAGPDKRTARLWDAKKVQSRCFIDKRTLFTPIIRFLLLCTSCVTWWKRAVNCI